MLGSCLFDPNSEFWTQPRLAMHQVLCRSGKAVSLSRDQTAEREDERARVRAAGGDVRKRMDGWRVGDVGLQVTRCAVTAQQTPDNVDLHHCPLAP